ncbi:MAG: hypothetical protein Kow00127_07030 [Bacteroidales bacterium]
MLLFLGYLIFNLFSYLPEPAYLLATFSFIFIIPPFSALNFIILNCDSFIVHRQNSFNGRQIFLLIIGGIFWILTLIELTI